ncbi:MAG: TonB-dependent receptor [Terracidiphilus sp.]
MTKTRSILTAIALVLTMGSFWSGNAAAQGLFGTIGGAVTDASGAVIPGATVKIINVSTNVETTITTNATGDYSASGLNPGIYRVEVSAKGFKNEVQNGIVLEVDGNPKASFKLQIGAASETVTVTGESTVMQTQTSSLGQTVDEEQLSDLPLSGSAGTGHSAYSLLQLSAGVTQQTGEGGYALDNARLNGGRPRMDDYLIDGTSTEQPTFGGPDANPSVDSVQELRVQTNNFAAEYGKVSGGVIELTTKSGTNKFHGSAYEYYQTSKLDANSYFSNLDGIPIQPSHFDEFGGTVGGPVLKSKLFFFTDYQGVRSAGSTTETGQIVPNANFLKGNLSALCTTGTFVSGICTNATFGSQLYNPAAGYAPFLNNQVPVSAIAQNLEALWPAGNAGNASVTGGTLWNGIYQYGERANRVNPRVDWFLGQHDHIFGVYHFESSYAPGNTVGWLDDASYQNLPVTTVTAGWTHTFTSSLLNDFHYGYDHRHPLRTTNGYGEAGDSDFGISAIPSCNYPGANGKCGPPSVGITGFSGLGAGGNMLIEPAGYNEFLDSVTLVRRAHSFKFGGEIRHAAINNIQPNQLDGSFDFNGNGTGNAFGDFLIGYLYKSTVQVQTNYLQVHSWADALYAQDDWKISKNLTFNLGVRWQFDPSWTSPNKELASFDPYNLTWIQNGVNGAPAGSIETHWKEFAPRLGFAWTPRKDLVVRGGYGMTYPGVLGHGRGGDGNVSPNLLAQTQINPGTYISALPTIGLPAATGAAPLADYQGEYFYYTPNHQAASYSEMWNFAIEKQFGPKSALTVAYSGSHGVHLPVNYAYNLCQQSAANIAQYGTAIEGGTIDSPYCAPGNINALGGPYGFYDDYVYPGWWGLSSSVYHGLQTTFDRRYSNGFALLTTFTWSKLLDDASSDWSGFGSLDVYGQDFYHRAAERSVSAGDIPLRFLITPIYTLPFGPGHKLLNHGVAGQTLGGWRASGIYSLTKGDPVGINDGGYLYCNPAMTVATRPVQIGNPEAGFKRGVGSSGTWFNTNAFDWKGTCAYYSNLYDSGNPYSGNPAYSFGNTPRYSSVIRAPDVDNLDASLQKELSLPHFGEQGRLRIQLDAFNALNHPEFSPPVGTASAQFGQVLSTRNGGRVVQLGAHLTF